MSEKVRLEKIKTDLDSISPLALPQYLINCEFYDMENSMDVLEKAITEFEKEGGAGKKLATSVLTSAGNSIFLLLLKKMNDSAYKNALKGKIKLGDMVKEMLSFSYPPPKKEHEVNLNSYNDNYLRSQGSGVGIKYDNKAHRDNDINQDFLDRSFAGDKAIKDETGRDVDRHNSDRSSRGEADHVTPLSAIHNQFGAWMRRYSDNQTLTDIMNDDKNFQVLAGNVNASKGGQTNNEYIEKVENIEKASELLNKTDTDMTSSEKEFLKKLSPGQKDKARILHKMNSGEQLTDEEKKKIDTAILSDEAKEALRRKQKESEMHLAKSMAGHGSITVLIEQIGKIVNLFIGPLAFEVMDSFKNGITHGFQTKSSLNAFGKRIVRVFSYVFSELPKLVGDLLVDMGKMLSTLLMSVLKAIRDFFGKFIDLLVNGIDLIVDAVKILCDKEKSNSKKGDAITKLLAGFVTNIVGTFIIDKILNSLGLPDPFSDIIATLISSFLSAAVVLLLEKLDLFSLKAELRAQRIKEIFTLRIEKLKKDSSEFDLVVSEKIRVLKKIQCERQTCINEWLDTEDFDGLNDIVSNIATELNIQIPYETSEDFVEFVRGNSIIRIAN